MLRPLLACCAALALAYPLAAQDVCYAENDGAPFNDGMTVVGGHLAVKFSPDVAVLVNRIEVFTGEASGGMTLGLWSHDVLQDQPQAALSFGAWTVNPANSWQGPDLATTVALDPAQDYWLVWGTLTGAQGSNDPEKAFPGQVFRFSADGGANWTPPSQSLERHFKFRLICGCSGPAVEYGAGCAGSGGVVPHLSLDTCPTAGAQVSLTISNALGGATALLFAGATPAALSVGDSGCDLLVAPIVVMLPVPLGGVGAGNGQLVLAAGLPAAAAGLTARLQAFILDPGPASGFAATNGVTLAIP